MLIALALLAANPMPQGDLGRTPFPASRPERDIQLVEETLVIDDNGVVHIPNFAPRAPDIAIPTVRYQGAYVLKNHSDKPRRLQVAFPIFELQFRAGGFPSELLEFKASLDDKALKVSSRRTEGRVYGLRADGHKGLAVLGRPDLVDITPKRPKLDEGDDFDLLGGVHWKRFEVQMPPGATRTLRLDYRSACGECDVPESEYKISYILRTGAHWRGKIEKATLRFIPRAGRSAKASYVMSPPATTASDEALVLVRKKFEPDFDLVITARAPQK